MWIWSTLLSSIIKTYRWKTSQNHKQRNRFSNSRRKREKPETWKTMQSYGGGRPSHEMVALCRNELHDRHRIDHVIVCQIAEQCIGCCAHGVADVRMKLSLIHELNVVYTLRRIVWNVLRCPVQILRWTTSIDNNKAKNKHYEDNNSNYFNLLQLLFRPNLITPSRKNNNKERINKTVDKTFLFAKKFNAIWKSITVCASMIY